MSVKNKTQKKPLFVESRQHSTGIESFYSFPSFSVFVYWWNGWWINAFNNNEKWNEKNNFVFCFVRLFTFKAMSNVN